MQLDSYIMVMMQRAEGAIIMKTSGQVGSKGKIYYSFMVLYLLFMVDFMTRVGINSLFPVIQADLGLSDSQIGLLGSVVLVGMAVFVLPVSYLGDKWSRKKMIIGLSFIWGVGTLLSALPNHYPTLIISRFLVGLGNSGYAAISVSMISGWFGEEQRGKVLSIYDTAMDLGFAVAVALCGFLAGILGWKMTLVFVGSLSLLITVLSFFISEEKRTSIAQSKQGDNQVSVKAAAKVVLHNRPLLAVSIGAGANNFLYTATFGWMTMFMVRDMGYSVAVAGSLVGMVSFVGILGYPIGGILLDKWYQKDIRSRVWVGALGAFCSMICHIAAFYFHFIPLFFVSYIFITMATAAPHIATQELVPQQFRAVSYGFYVIFIQGLGALGPILAGMLSQSYNLLTAMIAVQFAGLLATVAYVYAGKDYRAVYEKFKQK